MATNKHIRDQLEQLQMHRENVQFFRRQMLAHGGLAFAPVSTQRSLNQAYQGIARCKAVLRSWNTLVEDVPDDQPEEAETSTQTTSPADLEQAVQSYRVWVGQRYGQIQIMGMQEPVPLDEIFIDLVLLDRTSAWQRHSLDELRRHASLGDLLPPGAIPRSGLEVVAQTRRLYLLGRPGSGKSTFLRYLACTVAADVDGLPILVDLKEWARSGNGLADFLTEQITRSRISHGRAVVEQALAGDHTLLLFDGLDEVVQDQGARQRIIQAIHDLAVRHTGCRIVISCRTAADEHVLEGFTYAELADFSVEQVRAFAEKWFRSNTLKRDRFLEELDRPEYARLRELARTPLLLTLVCLSFEATLDFPKRRVDLYEAALDLLFQRWDVSRGVKRDGIYQKLPLPYKHQLLARIALETFERGELFMRRTELERLVTAFLARLPNAPPEKQIDARAVLAAIETQHGLVVARSHDVLGFSHLTFQEYFLAWAIVENPSDTTLQNLIGNAGDPRWREVLLMVAALLDEESAKKFFDLFVQMIQDVLEGDEEMSKQVALTTARGARASKPSSLASRAWHMFVWDLFDATALEHHTSIVTQRLEAKLTHTLNLDFDLTTKVARYLELSTYLDRNIERARDRALYGARVLARALSQLNGPDQRSDIAHFITSYLGHSQARDFIRELAEELVFYLNTARDIADDLVRTQIRSRTHHQQLILALEDVICDIQKLIKLLSQSICIHDLIQDAHPAPSRGLRYLVLAYHIGLHGDAERSMGLTAFWHSALANLPTQLPQVLALRTALEGCVTPTEDAPLEAWRTWLLAVSDVLIAHQHIDLEWTTKRAQGSALGPYLAATALLHECLEQAIVNNREQILDQLLTIPAV